MILDTSFLIDIMTGEEKAVQKLKSMVKSQDPQLITAPTIFELFSGLARSRKPEKEKSKMEKVLGDQIILGLTNDSAEKAGVIDGTLVGKGQRIGVIDSMIGGIALVKKDKVLTRNVKDFSKIRGLDIEEY